MSLETKIIQNLIHNEDYCRKVLPFTEPKFFEDGLHKAVVAEVIEYFNTYNKQISTDILEIEVQGRKDISHGTEKELPKFIESLKEYKQDNIDWLLHETEKFFQKRAVYLAILDSIQIIDGSDKKRSEDAIPSMLQDALALTFDTQIGHDYFDDAEARFEYYRKKEEGIEFDVELLNKITGGVGLRKKTLTAIAARCVHPDTIVKVRVRKKI
jgi:hypothetical protein